MLCYVTLEATFLQNTGAQNYGALQVFPHTVFATTMMFGKASAYTL